MGTRAIPESSPADDGPDESAPDEPPRRTVLEEAIERANSLASHYDEQRVVVRIGPATWADAWSAGIGAASRPLGHSRAVEAAEAAAPLRKQATRRRIPARRHPTRAR
jgi:hypothetical protein